MRQDKTEKSNQSKAASISAESVLQNAPLTQGAQETSKIEGLRQEYTEVNTSLRHYSNLRFAMFTVFFATITGLLSVAFGFFKSETQNSDDLKLWGRIGGLLITLLFFHYESRLQAVRDQNMEVAEKLETLLGYHQISSRPKWRLSTALVTKYFYWLMIAFWLVMVIKMLIIVF